jgi:hypothetical protein
MESSVVLIVVGIVVGAILGRKIGREAFTLDRPWQRNLGNLIWPPAFAGFFLLKWYYPSAFQPWGYVLLATGYIGIVIKLTSGRWYRRKAPAGS